MPRRSWTDAELIAALQAHAVEGVALSSTEWRRSQGDGRPSVRFITQRFGGWAAAVSAAALTSQDEAREARKAEEEKTRAAQPGKESSRNRWARERREEKLALIAEDVAAGSLRIRQATPEEREEWVRGRAERAARKVPRVVTVEADEETNDADLALSGVLIS
jgi:hypothetical protein